MRWALLLILLVGTMLPVRRVAAGGKCREEPTAEVAPWKVWRIVALDLQLSYPPDWDVRPGTDQQSAHLTRLSGHPKPGTKCGAIVLARIGVEVHDPAGLTLEAWIDQRSLEAVWAKKRGNVLRRTVLPFMVGGGRAVQVVEESGRDDPGFIYDDTVYVQRGKTIVGFTRMGRKQHVETMNQILKSVKLSCD